MRGYKGKFKGVFHAYYCEITEKQEIEEFYFDCFEETLPSEDRGHNMWDEFHDSHYEKQLLELPEVEAIKSEDFYFEILGEMEINFFSSSWEYPNEVDSEMIIDKYVIKEMDRKPALEIGGFPKENEKVELRGL